MISVLYVDDEQPLLETTKIFLERSRTIRVDIADSAITALRMIRSTRYDAIVADYQMPVMDGIALLREVRKEFPVLPYIIFTGKGRYDVVIEALNCGADHYLQKGGDPRAQFAELAGMIAASVAKRKAMDTNRHLLGLYAALAGTSRAIPGIHDTPLLFDTACRIAVMEGGFRMAWIGLMDPKNYDIRPVAAFGFLPGSQGGRAVPADDVPRGTGLSAVAVREGKPAITDEIASDPRMIAFRPEAARRGFVSSASVPLRHGKRIVGAMTLYAGEADFFGEREAGLLVQLAGDIGTAIDRIENQ